MFGYLRTYSIVSLAALTVLGLLGGMWFRTYAEEDITSMIDATNRSILQGFERTVWQDYRDLLGNTDAMTFGEDAKSRLLKHDTQRYFESMPLAEVNIYASTGALLMKIENIGGIQARQKLATEDRQALALAIRSGIPSTKVLKDAAVNMPSGATSGTLVRTLVPVNSPTGGVMGAIEMFYDITPQWNHMQHFTVIATACIIGAFVLFLLLLAVLTRKAEMIIARQHEANLELTATVASAQAETREKSLFLANVSHELRTPLNAIIGFSEIIKTELLSGNDPAKYNDYVNDIHHSGVHLLSLINDILDYSKAEAGKLEMEVSEVNACKMIQNSLRLVSPRAETAKVRLIDALPKDAAILICDGKKFKQIMLNLLSNAVKFTPAGGQVKVAAWRNVTDDSYTFEVQDTGIGIAPKDISRAMAVFGQVDNTLSRKYDGTGLGLPLTKKFVELMGGRFAIKSEVNTGTTVTFTLPREAQAHEGVVIKHASQDLTGKPP